MYILLMHFKTSYPLPFPSVTSTGINIEKKDLKK